jgi:hypothetical protein
VFDDAVADYGGELPFWNAWVLGDVPPRVKNAVRAEGERWPALKADVESVDPRKESSPTPEGELRNANEAVIYLTDRPVKYEQGSLPDITETVLTPAGLSKSQLDHWLRDAVLPLWSELDLPVPTDDVRFGTEVYHTLVSGTQINRFLDLHHWLETRRDLPSDQSPLALERVLRWLTPQLFEAAPESPDKFRYRLSFRLMLRAALKRFCRTGRFRPTGRIHPDLETAFERLSYERLGELLREMFDSAPRLASDQGGQLARASSQLAAGG